MRSSSAFLSVTRLPVEARATCRGTHSRAGDSSAVRSMEAPRGGVASGRASIAIEASRAAAAAAGAARRRPPGAATFNAVGIANGAGSGAGQVGTVGAATAGAGAAGSVANAAANGAAASKGALAARVWAAGAGAGGTQGSGGASPGCAQIV